jgi:hypothetical protein
MGVAAALGGPHGPLCALADTTGVSGMTDGAASSRAPLGQVTRSRGAAMTAIHSDELRPGDVVEYHGKRHVVSRIDRIDGAAWSVATDGTGWAIALGRELVFVERP